MNSKFVEFSSVYVYGVVYSGLFFAFYALFYAIYSIVFWLLNIYDN